MKQGKAHNYDYDIVVIGGAAGGLAAGKEAARLGKKVAVYNFEPSPPSATLLRSGNFANVGFILKQTKYPDLVPGKAGKDIKSLGLETESEVIKQNWTKIVEDVQTNIGSINVRERAALMDKAVTYLYESTEFLDEHSVKTTNLNGEEETVTADKFILAIAGASNCPEIPGAEFGISCDDIYSLSHAPGKTLLVGDSYKALECSCFLANLGYDTTIMARSSHLRGFDQQIAGKILEYMGEHGVNIVKECVPIHIERVEEGSKPVKLKVNQPIISLDECFHIVI